MERCGIGREGRGGLSGSSIEPVAEDHVRRLQFERTDVRRRAERPHETLAALVSVQVVHIVAGVDRGAAGLQIAPAGLVLGSDTRADVCLIAENATGRWLKSRPSGC